jgi:hypothetical protein
MTEAELFDPFILTRELFTDHPDLIDIEEIVEPESKLLEVHLKDRTACVYTEIINGTWENGHHIAPPLAATADMLEEVENRQLQLEDSDQSDTNQDS